MKSPSSRKFAWAFCLLFTATCWASPVIAGSNHLVAPSFGRNIRQLPCLSKATQQMGVCMFAWDCMKANGTHLGTCIDRFYFGSCCHLDESIHAGPVTTPPFGSFVGNGESEHPSINGLDVSSHLPTLPVATPLLPLSGFSTLAPLPTQSSPGLPLTTVSQMPERPLVTSFPSSLPPTHVPEFPVVSNIPIGGGSSTTMGLTTPGVLPTLFSTLPVVAATPASALGNENPVVPQTTFSPPASGIAPQGIPTTGQVVSEITEEHPSSVVSSGSSSPSLPIPTTSQLVPVTPPTLPIAVTEQEQITTAVYFEAETTSQPEAFPPAEVSTSSAVLPGVETDAGSFHDNNLEYEVTTVASTENSIDVEGIASTDSPSLVDLEVGAPVTDGLAEEYTTEQERPFSEEVQNMSEFATSSTESLTTTTSSTSPPTVPTTPSPTISEVSSISSLTSTEPITSSPPTDTIISNSSSSASPTEPITLAPVPNPGFPDFRKVCGRPLLPKGRIVGGSMTQFGEWPWQISLRQWRSSTFLHKCGAALLNENWAITAAHCVENIQPEDLLLRLGDYDLATEDEAYPYVERKVQIVASHPQFDSRTFEYDLALLRFYDPVPFQPNIVPICIPEPDDANESFVGRMATVTGWGRLYEDGPLPSKLQQVNVPVINNTDCESMYRKAGFVEHIPKIFICAGYAEGKKDSCEGDSGGPMVLHSKDRWVLGGIISWGIGCAATNQPGVYTRISEFGDWINQIIVF